MAELVDVRDAEALAELLHHHLNRTELVLREGYLALRAAREQPEEDAALDSELTLGRD
jgi:hypothetical protein